MKQQGRYENKESGSTYLVETFLQWMNHVTCIRAAEEGGAE